MRIFREWVLAIALFVALILDGSLSFYLHQFLVIGEIGASCFLLPIGIMLIGLFDDTNSKEIWLALGAGVIADIFNLGFIGVYTVFLPLSCYLCQRVARILPETFWARLVVVLIGTSLLEVYSCFILKIVGIATVSNHNLLLSILISLPWTILFFSATYWIWGSLAQNYPFLIDLDAYQQ